MDREKEPENACYRTLHSAENCPNRKSVLDEAREICWLYPDSKPLKRICEALLGCETVLERVVAGLDPMADANTLLAKLREPVKES